MRLAPLSPLTCLIISLLATACGGGGSNSSDTPPATNFTLSGTITSSSSQTVDSDTNDDTRPAVSNDDLFNPQIIPNPITLGGYVNQPGSGAAGRSQQAGDINDFFQVDLLAGQRVTMLVADFIHADADLFLLDLQGNRLGFSLNTGEVESLLIPEDGTYLVQVFALEGATNYILAIGAPNTASQYQAEPFEIVPWQAVVTYRDDSATTNSARSHESLAQEFGLEQRGGGRGRGRLMTMRRDLVNAPQGKLHPGSAEHIGASISDPELRARWETLMTIKSLRKNPQIRHAEPNYRMTTMAVPNDTAYPLQWHYPLIGLPEAWEITTGDPGVVVAVIDTGVLPNHPDLAGQLVAGYDFVRDPQSSGDGDGIDADPRDPGSAFGSASSRFHGTHVIGTVAARGNNLQGVAGTAYSSRVMPLRAVGADGSGESFDVEQAVRYAAGLPNDSGTVPQNRADIINLSLGGAPFSPITQDLFNEVRAAGVSVVAAAGNQASTSPTYPAAYEGVISVSAVNAQRQVTSYSNTGTSIDVAAPGGDRGNDLNGDGYADGVYSTGGAIGAGGLSYGYFFLDGTSMAAPHVAGVLALMKSVNPDLTPADIDTLLLAGALTDDLGAPGRDNLYGNGMINAQRAVFAALEAAGQSPADNPRLVASASTLNFGGSSSSLMLSLQNGGKGDLVLQSLSVSQPWLQVTAASVDEADLGEYTVTVDRSTLSTGIYTAEITAQSSVNNVAVRVLVSKGDGSFGADIGVIYILLYDPLLNETVAQIATGSNGTNYPFQLTNVPAGEYTIVAGTDTDNDLIICDAGEACGAWLTVDQPILIDLQGDVTDLNFPVEYIVSLPTTINSASQPGTATELFRGAQALPEERLRQLSQKQD